MHEFAFSQISQSSMSQKQSLFEFDSIEYLGTLYSFQFDYSLVKTINEKFLLKSELIVKQLLRPEWISIFPYHFYNDTQLSMLHLFKY